MNRAGALSPLRGVGGRSSGPTGTSRGVNRLATLTPDWSAPLGRRVLAVASAPSGVALTAPGPQAPNQAGVCPPKTQAAGPQKKEVSVRPALSEPRGHGPRQ